LQNESLSGGQTETSTVDTLAKLSQIPVQGMVIEGS
jgi:hypothetical protein